MTRQEMLPVCLAKNSNKVGGTKATLLKFLIENGNRGLNEIVQNVGTDAQSRNAIRTCLYRSRLQGLVIRDEYGGYSFNPNAVQFCSLISEQMRNSLERAGYTPPPPKPDGNSTPVSDKIERESFTSHVHELHDSYMTATDELHDDINSITDGTSLGQIGHNPVLDPMKAGPPPQFGYGGGSGYGPNPPARAVGRSATPEKFIPLSETEKDSALAAVEQWQCTTTPAAAKLVGKLLAHCFARQKNSVTVSRIEEAAQFCLLSLEEFEAAIRHLQNERKVYYFDNGRVRKIGIYVSWLNLLRRGDF
jgi:hypothetical protein